jgi:serine/threonine protein phosphatase PrpC
MVIKEKYFHEAAYVDLAGARHSHLVHNKQLPLPYALAKGLGEEQVEVLNNLDYWVCLDQDKIAEELEANLLMADLLGDRGYNSHFDSLGLSILEQCGHAAAEGPYGKTTVEAGWLGDMGISTSIGFRKEMEDAHAAGVFSMPLRSGAVEVFYCALFDGHGGAACAAHAAKNFIPIFTKWALDPSLCTRDDDIKIYNAINLGLADLNRTFLGELEGSTATICLMVKEELWVVNLGDSRAIYVTPERIVQLSEDQKPFSNREIIEGRGGMITGDNRIMHNTSFYSIAPGRGIGDHHLKGGMSPRPVISKFKLPKEREHGYLLLACDGVFDLASTNQVGEFVSLCDQIDLDPAQIAGAVAIRAIRAGSTDNITVLVKKG